MPNGLLVWFSLLLIELGLAKILGPHDFGVPVRQPISHMPLYGRAIAAVGLRQLYLQVYYDKPRRVRL